MSKISLKKIFPNDIEIGNSKTQFCSICLDDKNVNCFYEAKCKHKWCMECHSKLIKYSELCPLCRKNFMVIEYKKKNDSIKNLVIIKYIIIHFIYGSSILFIGRLYWILLFCFIDCNYFINADEWLMTSFFGFIFFILTLILLSLSLSWISYFMIKCYDNIYKSC